MVFRPLWAWYVIYCEGKGGGVSSWVGNGVRDEVIIKAKRWGEAGGGDRVGGR